MKEILMFMLPRCPHCKRARGMIEELCTEHPEYAAVPIKMVDEEEEVELANCHDYNLVPCFYVDEVKLHEGVPSKESIENVFKKALA